MNHHRILSQYYILIKRPEQAVSAMQEAFRIQEQIFDNDVLERATELEQLYEKEKREIEIDRLNTKNELQALSVEKSTRERNGFIILSILIIGVTVLIFRLYKQNKKSLLERETLLKEIHHRVKNNLQIISSLLNIQAAHLKDDAAKDAVREGQNRVKSMALIHERLYRNDNLSGVSVDDYISNLVHNLFNSFGVDEEKIIANLEVESLKLDIDTLIPLGLILNELITNSLKYAFNGKGGNIYIHLSQQHGELNLQVKDDGAGMDESILETTNSYGWKMVQSLARKLKAEITITSNSGTEISLWIKNFKLVA